MNRDKLLTLFVSNLSNAVVHKILEKAIDIPEISERYNKEIINSWDIAKRYRERINPVEKELTDKDIQEIRKKIVNKVKSELRTRIEKGYENIDLESVEEVVEEVLKEMKIKEWCIKSEMFGYIV